MIDSELPTDLRRPGTPSRGPASAVLAHPSTDGLAPVLGAEPRSGAPEHRISRRQSESIIQGLNEVVRRCLDSGRPPVRGGQRPHLTVTATLETLRGDPGSPAAEIDFGWPVSGETLRRIACDAELTPILVGRSGDPLPVGRRPRTAPPRLRPGPGRPGPPRPAARCR